MTESTLTAPKSDDIEPSGALLEAERREASRLGRALKVLRTRAGLSREQAGARIGLGERGWSKYETGQAAGIFRPSVQARLSEALGQPAEALTEELARIAALQSPTDYPGLPDARP